MEDTVEKVTKYRPPIRDGILKISVSQVESCDPVEDGCYRQWWFKSVMKLPQLKTKATAFGDILHEVAERFLRADDFGRDEHGNPVDLFPPDWERSVNRWTGQKSPPISEPEKVAIKSLISEAISTGMLNRQKGREVEKSIRHEMLVHEGVKAVLSGFIDLREPGAMKDHKTSSNRRYMKSVNKLRKNNQLVTYAFVDWEQGNWPKDKTILLEHLYYVKDKATGKLSTERRFVEIQYADALRHVNERLTPVIKQMIEYALCIDPEEGYINIPFPKDVQRACSKYGGCAYSDICTKAKTIDQYVAHVERVQEAKAKTTEGDSTMGLMDKYNAIKGKDTSKATAPATTPKATAPATVSKATAPATDSRPSAPWAGEQKCPTCAQSPVKGIRGGTACPVCVVRAKKAGLPSPEGYEIISEENDIMVVSPEGELVVEYMGEAPEVQHKEKGESRSDVEAKAKAKAEAEAEAEAKANAEAEAEAESEAETKANAEAEAKANAEAEAKAKSEAEVAKSLLAKAEAAAVSKDTQDDAEMALEFVTSRGKGLLLINCAFTTNAPGNKAKIGSPACMITGEELLESAKAMIMGTPEFRKEQLSSQITYWEELNAFKRKELLTAFAPKIADLLSKSSIQCAMIPAGSDLMALVSAISPYFTTINALA